MAVVISPSGGACQHVNVLDDVTSEIVGTMTLDDYGRIVGMPVGGWTTQAATNRATMVTQATTALAGNATYIALASPSAAQNTAQIKALTQQNNKIIRLLVNKLDATT